MADNTTHSYITDEFNSGYTTETNEKANRVVDIGTPIPYFQWEDAYKEAGMSGKAMYDKNGSIVYKADVSAEDLQLIADTNTHHFRGVYSELSKSFGVVTVADLLNDPQTIPEVFVQLNPKTKEVIAYLQLDNPLLLDDNKAIAFIPLNKAQIEKAVNVAVGLAKEFTAAHQKGVDIKSLDVKSEQDRNIHYFEEHKDRLVAETGDKLKSFKEIADHYDNERLERVIDTFKSRTHQTFNLLWENYEKDFNTPDTKEICEDVHSKMIEIRDDTCNAFEEIGHKALKTYKEEVGEQADRNFLQMMCDIGDNLGTSVKEMTVATLDKVKTFIKDVGNDVKQAGSTVKNLFAALKDRLGKTREDVEKQVDDRIKEEKEKPKGEKKSITERLISAGTSFVAWTIDRSLNLLDSLRGKLTEFDKYHKAQGFKSIDPNYSDIKSETTPFIKALGVRVDRDENGNVTDLIYTPRLNKEELREVVSRSDEMVAGKTLTEWLEDPEAKVELSVTVPTEGIAPATAFVSDRNGEAIGYAYIDLTRDEIKQITQVAREVGGKAVLIDDIADKIYGEKFNEENAKDWVAYLKSCPFEELATIANTLNLIPTQDGREGWAMGYLAKTEREEPARDDTDKKAKTPKKKAEMER